MIGWLCYKYLSYPPKVETNVDKPNPYIKDKIVITKKYKLVTMMDTSDANSILLYNICKY